MTDTPYKVGYGRPPAARRFKPGRSGNPKGRPRGAKNFDTLLAQLMDEKISVTGRRKARFETLIESLVDKAIEGDVSSLVRVFQLMQTHDRLHEPVTFKTRDNKELIALLELMRRDREDK